MKKSLFIYLGSFWITLVLIVLAPLTLMAQEVTLHKQRAFPKTVSAGNYSGIAWLGGSKYAIANDKSPTAGFYLMTILFSLAVCPTAMRRASAICLRHRRFS